MLSKIKAFFGVLMAGRALVDSAKWKSHQVTVNVVTGFLSTSIVLARLYGVQLEISDADLGAIAGGIFAFVGLFFNPYITVATTEKIGLPSSNKPPPSEGGSRDIESTATEQAQRTMGGG